MSNQHYVHIIKTETGEVVRQLGPMTAAKADRVENGANINLDHDTFHTEQKVLSKEEAAEHVDTSR